MGDRDEVGLTGGSGRPHIGPAVGLALGSAMVLMPGPGATMFGGIEMGLVLSVAGFVLTGLYSHSLPVPVHRKQGCPSLLFSHLHPKVKKIKTRGVSY